MTHYEKQGRRSRAGDHDGDTALLYSRVQALDVIVQVLLELIKQNVGIGPAQLFLDTVETWVIPQIYEILSEDRDNARFIEGLEAAFAEYLPKYLARVSWEDSK